MRSGFGSRRNHVAPERAERRPPIRFQALRNVPEGLDRRGISALLDTDEAALRIARPRHGKWIEQSIELPYFLRCERDVGG